MLIAELDEGEGAGLEVPDPIEEAAKVVLHVRRWVSRLKRHDRRRPAVVPREHRDLERSRSARSRSPFDLQRENRILDLGGAAKFARPGEPVARSQRGDEDASATSPEDRGPRSLAERSEGRA